MAAQLHSFPSDSAWMREASSGRDQNSGESAGWFQRIPVVRLWRARFQICCGRMYQKSAARGPAQFCHPLSSIEASGCHPIPYLFNSLRDPRTSNLLPAVSWLGFRGERKEDPDRDCRMFDPRTCQALSGWTCCSRTPCRPALCNELPPIACGSSRLRLAPRGSGRVIRAGSSRPLSVADSGT